MKFILYITMLVVVLMPTQGFTLYQHFCGGKLISLAVHHEDLDRCCEESACGSCQDQETWVHLDEFQATENTIIFQAGFELIYGNTYSVIANLKPNLLLVSINGLDTPLFYCSGRQRSILHQSFLI